MVYVISLLFFTIIVSTMRSEKMKLYEILLIGCVAILQALIPELTIHTLQVSFLLMFYFLIAFIILKDLYKAILISIFQFIGIMIVTVLFTGTDIWLYHGFVHELTFPNVIYVVLKNITLCVLIITSKSMLKDENKFHRGIIITINLTTLALILYYDVMKDIGLLGQYYLNDNDIIRSVFLIIIIFYFQLTLAARFYYNITKINKMINEEFISSTFEFIELSKQKNYDLISKIKTSANSKDFNTVLKLTDEYLFQSHTNMYHHNLINIEDRFLTHYLEDKIAKNPEVAFDFQINQKDVISKFNKEKYFLEIIGIIIDNALNAAKKSEEKLVQIIISDNSIKITNSYHEDDLSGLITNSSARGNKNRINGLKLLKHISSKSEITIIKTIHDNVCFEMVVG